MAFAADGRVWSIPVAGGEPSPLGSRSGVDALDTASSADGRSLFWGGKTHTGWQVWRVPVSPETGEPVGEPVEVATSEALPYRHLAVSRDARKLAYVPLRSAGDLMALRLSPSGDPVGQPSPLTASLAFRKSGPSFFPDGRRLSFTLWSPGAGNSLWLVDSDGSNPSQLTTRPAGGGLGWTPDGRRVAYLSPGADRASIWSADVASGQETLLLEADTWFLFPFPRLSPDGRSVAFQAPSGGVLNVWTVDVPGGKARPLTADREGIGWPAYSPDVRQLAVELLRGGHAQVAVLPASGGALRQLTFGPGQSWPHTWSPDGRRIAFAGQRDGIWNVFWVGTLDGRQRRLTDYKRVNTYARYPAWSPRGGRIVYEYAETTGNVWMMDLK